MHGLGVEPTRPGATATERRGDVIETLTDQVESSQHLFFLRWETSEPAAQELDELFLFEQFVYPGSTVPRDDATFAVERALGEHTHGHGRGHLAHVALQTSQGEIGLGGSAGALFLESLLARDLGRAQHLHGFVAASRPLAHAPQTVEHRAPHAQIGEGTKIISLFGLEALGRLNESLAAVSAEFV